MIKREREREQRVDIWGESYDKPWWHRVTVERALGALSRSKCLSTTVVLQPHSVRVR